MPENGTLQRLKNIESKQDRVLGKLDDLSTWQRSVDSSHAATEVKISNIVTLVGMNADQITSNRNDIKTLARNNKVLSTISAAIGGLIGSLVAFLKP